MDDDRSLKSLLEELESVLEPNLPQSTQSNEYDEEMVYQCPLCDSLAGADATSCPGCGAIFIEEEEQTPTMLVLSGRPASKSRDRLKRPLPPPPTD